MHSAGTNAPTKGRLNVSDIGPRFGSTRLAGALTLALLSTLLLIAPRPAQAQTETVLYNFIGGSDGSSPNAHLTADSAGNFYGTTAVGGLGYGTVFELSPNGSGGWNETVLYSFSGGADGAYPTFSYVMLDSAGNLYGTAYQDGANGNGVVFKLSLVGGNWTETVLYSFTGGTDGGNPVNGLITDTTGNFYGTTLYGGAHGNGTVFELSPSGGGWTEQVIYNRNQSSSGYAGLTMDAVGNIFGVGYSKVFELSPNRHGGWNASVIYTFTSHGIDAQGTLVLDPAGNLYGTTCKGGSSGEGTVYKLSPGNKGWEHRTIFVFPYSAVKGIAPWGGIVLDAAGNIYGTTTAAGGRYGDGFGTVFEIVPPPSDSGRYQVKVIWVFNHTDGANPYASLLLDGAGNLYGTTLLGGSNGNGVVFEVTP